MRKQAGYIVSFCLAMCCYVVVSAQSIHFSQYYNSPLLTNPANTALNFDNDYRVGAIYRNQWATVPVPYSTFSAFGDFVTAGGNEMHPNWLGLGVAMFSDKAGDGNLSLSSFQGSAAYHLHLNDQNILSFGLSGAFVQRSVNYDNLTFDVQWDGATFNKSSPNGERSGTARTNYYTVAAGADYSYFPSDAFYVNVGVGVANINQPQESFYGASNTVGIRPTASIDALVKVSHILIVNPSVYFTEQQQASELIGGLLFRVYLAGDKKSAELILGLYDRVNDAVIPTVGFQWANLQVLGSYDITTSSLAPYNGGQGALEISLIYQGLYGRNNSNAIKRSYNCPRFF